MKRVALFTLILLVAAAPAHAECVERHDMTVYIAIDMSSSMEGSNLTVARNFAVQLLDELGATGVVDEASSLQFCAEVIVDNPWMSANDLRDLLSGLSVTCAHPDLSAFDGTSLYGAIVLTANVIRGRSSPVKLHVVITDGEDTTSTATAADATAALAPGGIIGRLIFVGGGSSTLESIANNAGPHIQYREATSGNITTIVNDILDATCANFRPNASFTISDTEKHLGTEGFTITFDPSGSTDDGSITSFAWRFTRPDGSTFDLSANPLTQTFDDSQLTVGEEWSVRLTVTDNRGSTDTETKTFRVIGSPPSISIPGAPEIELDVLELLQLEATPTTDVDGGNLSFQWHVDAKPAGSTSVPTLAGETFSLDTVEDDIGTWEIRVVATDDEGDTDEAEITVHVRNLPPEIDFSGLDEIDIGDSIEVETTILDDPDGGLLSFEWDIIQSPDPSGTPPQEGYFGGTGAAGATLSIATSASDAGTWIVRLTATDNDNQPNSSVSEEFTVLVDAPVEADATGPDAIGSLSFPLVLTSAGSTDPDTDAPHSTLDGRPVVVSPGIVDRVWRLTDVPFELWSEYPLGRVDEVFGVFAGGEEMELDFLDIANGQWLFQADITDGEGNEDSDTHSVMVTDENTNPTAIAGGVQRYLVQAGSNILNEDVVLDGSFSFDLDDILAGGTDGLDTYAWTIDLAPPACTPPAIPDGAVSVLFSGGSVVPLECHGMWRITLTVTDLDAPAKSGTTTQELIIGNCPAALCIDYPTTIIPEFVDFTDRTDVTIVYHLDSAIYSDPLFGAGMFAELAIFHESDLTVPFYTDIDFNVLPTDSGGLLVFNWNGYSNFHERPPEGRYTVRIALFDALLAASPFEAVEAESIWIAVADPQVLPSSDQYKNVDRLDDGSELLAVDWEITGSAVPDQVVWRLRDGSSAVVHEDTVAPAMSGTILWDGRIGALLVNPGAYEIEVEALRFGDSLGVSDGHPVVLYRLTTTPQTLIHPTDAQRHLVFVNGDDDNANASPDTADSPVAGEDDLAERDLVIEPLGVDLRAVLRATSGAPNVKIWETLDKSSEIVLEQTYDLSADVPPASIFIEGAASGETELEWALQEPDGTPIEEVTIPVSVAEVDVDVDTNMSGAVDFTDDLAETNDQAIVINVNNDSDGGATDSLDGVINGATDKGELTLLTLRRNNYLPAGWKMVLRVSNKAKIRIFDDTDTAVIGPPAADGGPNVQEFDVPTAKITAGDLTYRIETVHHDLSTISLILFNGATEVRRDELKAALNVHREPGAAYSTIRNRIFVQKSIADVRGLEANLTGSKPIISWAPTMPNSKTTSYWVSIQDNAVTGWLQSGVRTLRSAAGVDSEELYFEFVPDYTAYSAGTDPLGYQIHVKAGEGWRGGTFRVDKTGATLDTGEASLDGVVWQTITHPNLPAVVFQNYVIGTEPKQSIARNPGTTAAKAVVSAAQFKDAAGWHATTFTATDLHIHITDGRGTVSSVTAVPPANDAVNDHFHFNWLSGQSFEHWDDR